MESQSPTRGKLVLPNALPGIAEPPVPERSVPFDRRLMTDAGVSVIDADLIEIPFVVQGDAFGVTPSVVFVSRLNVHGRAHISN